MGAYRLLSTKAYVIIIMNYIYFASYEGKSFLSWFIKFRTWSRKSHSSIFLPDLQTVIEAWREGVVMRHWDEGHEPGTIIDIYRVPCTADQGAKFYRRAISYIGKGYDFGGIFGFALRIKTASSKSLFCSELVFQCAMDAGLS